MQRHSEKVILTHTLTEDVMKDIKIERNDKGEIISISFSSNFLGIIVACAVLLAILL